MGLRAGTSAGLRPGIGSGTGASAKAGGGGPAAPEITAQPVGGEYDGVTPFEITGLAYTPEGATVQWESSPAGAGTWSEVEGETGDTITVSPEDATDYRAVVTNGGQSVTSNTAAVTSLARIERLATNAAFIFDKPRGATLPFTTANGSTPSGDGDAALGWKCEKAPAGAGTYINSNGGHVYRVGGAQDILGAGILESTGGSGIISGGAGNTTPGDFLSQTKWWLLFHARLSGTDTGLTIEIYRSDTNNARLQLFYQPSTGTLRLAVHNGTSNTNYDHVISNGSVVRFAAYFDGTDLHRWVNDVARADNAGTGGLGTFDAGPRFCRGQVANRQEDRSALWLGKLDGSNAAQHMADIAAWMAYKAA